MVVILTIIRPRVASHPRPISKVLSRNCKLVLAASYSTLGRDFCLRAPTLSPPSTSRKTTPQPATSVGHGVSRKVLACYSQSIANFTSAGEALRSPNMAADDDYMDFLNKANEDPSLGSAKAQASQGNKEFKAADDGVDVPQTLVTATKDAFYVSDSDEPFVPVSLAWEKGEGLPDEEEIAKLVGHWSPTSAEVEILDPIDWDRNGQYKNIVEAVQKAGKGNDVRVYRIARDGSRAEYFVVTRQGDGKEARLVGVKALSIES